MNTTPAPAPTPAGTVVVGVDGSVSAGQALDWAIDQAVAEHRPITLAYGAPPADAMWMDQAGFDQRIGVRTLLERGGKHVEEARTQVRRRAPELEVHEVLRAADPRDVLLELAREAAMVVIGSRGRGPLRSLLLGSVGVAVSRHAACPVVIHRPGNPGVVRHGILVGIDGTESSTSVLEFAYRQASLRRLPLTVVHAYWEIRAAAPEAYLVSVRDVDPEEERLAMAECISGMGEKYPDVRVTSELTRGLPDDVLVRRGARMNMVVVGSHHGGVASEILFGSVAASVVEHATCPVAVVPRS